MVFLTELLFAPALRVNATRKNTTARPSLSLTLPSDDRGMPPAQNPPTPTPPRGPATPALGSGHTRPEFQEPQAGAARPQLPSDTAFEGPDSPSRKQLRRRRSRRPRNWQSPRQTAAGGVDTTTYLCRSCLVLQESIHHPAHAARLIGEKYNTFHPCTYLRRSTMPRLIAARAQDGSRPVILTALRTKWLFSAPPTSLRFDEDLANGLTNEPSHLCALSAHAGTPMSQRMVAHRSASSPAPLSLSLPPAPPPPLPPARERWQLHGGQRLDSLW